MNSGSRAVPPPTPRKPERPIFWIVAGPNGCGKSSLYNRTDIEGWGGSVWIINPDLLTEAIVERERPSLHDANLTAVRRIERWLEASLDTYQTIGVETVLSTDKYRRLIELAHQREFEVRMLYVVLQSVELQLERIEIRVQSGGHAVPAKKVAERRQRSFEQFAWFVRHVDQTYVFDNSDGIPQLAAAWEGDRLGTYQSLPPDLLGALKSAGTLVTHHLR